MTAEPQAGSDPFADLVTGAFPYLVGGLVVSPLLLALPASIDLTARFVIHLALLVGLGFALALRLAPLADRDFFAGRGWRPGLQAVASASVPVVVVTGAVALVTLASSAALRFQPSLQFLQLLSALDISWAAAAVVVGARKLWGMGPAASGGLLVGVVCVASIWNYMRVVGFTAGGGWLLDGGKLMTLVIPADTVVAVVAIAVLVAGARYQPTEQARDQS